jgi:hypothetical protein
MSKPLTEFIQFVLDVLALFNADKAAEAALEAFVLAVFAVTNVPVFESFRASDAVLTAG